MLSCFVVFDIFALLFEQKLVAVPTVTKSLTKNDGLKKQFQAISQVPLYNLDTILHLVMPTYHTESVLNLSIQLHWTCMVN